MPYKTNPFTALPDYYETIVTTTQIYAGDYASLQDAVDAAEALAGSTGDSGIGVLIPDGDYSSQTVTIRKNVNLTGMGSGSVLVGTIEYRPISNVAGPMTCLLRGVSVNTLTANNETAVSSGVYFLDMFNPTGNKPGLFIQDCAINTQLNLLAISRVRVARCEIFADAILFNMGQEWHFQYCQWFNNPSTVAISSDDTSPQLPTGLNPVVYFWFCQVPGITVTETSGATAPACYCLHSYVTGLTVNANCTAVLYNSLLSVPATIDPAASFSGYVFMPYTPSVGTDWSPATALDVGVALDQLASRVKALEP